MPVFVGDTVDFEVDITADDFDNVNVTWSVEDEYTDKDIATVDSRGLVTCNAAGKCTITATVPGGKKAKCQFEILEASEITLSAERTEVKDITPKTAITVKGKITSVHELTNVTVRIIAVDENGNESTAQRHPYDNLNTKIFDLYTKNDDIVFGDLPVGKYRFIVDATDKHGFSKNLQNDAFEVTDVKIVFGTNANASVVSAYSLECIKESMRKAGVTYCTITSTIRTPEDQARAMFYNCENYGAQKQLSLYKPAGQQVIYVYIQNNDNEKFSDEQIMELMAAKIRELQAQGQIVSQHCVAPEVYAKRNLIDIGYMAIGEQVPQSAFRSALQTNSKITKYIDEDYNRCHHIEIAQ